jgi:hypothetical protein
VRKPLDDRAERQRRQQHQCGNEDDHADSRTVNVGPPVRTVPLVMTPAVAHTSAYASPSQSDPKGAPLND